MTLSRVAGCLLVLVCALALGACGSESGSGDDGAMVPGGQLPGGAMQPGGMLPGGGMQPGGMQPGTPPPGDPGVVGPVAGTMDPGTGLPDPSDPCVRKDGWVSSKGMCGIDTGLMGDEACLVAPAADQGFQIHVGPADAKNPGPFAIGPGMEDSVCFGDKTSNGEKIFYQGSELSGRPGTHHIINTMHSSGVTVGTFQPCLDFGTGTAPTSLGNLPGASKAYMPRPPVAPENANLGSSIPANALFQADMHYFNFGGTTLVREFWLNIYYAEPGVEVQEANQIRGMGGFLWNIAPIPPGTDKVYPYSCPIKSDGRIIGLLGHTHAHGVRETAWINRGKPTEQKVFEQFDYLEPQIFYYNSCIENPPFADGVPGASSGAIEVKAGDTFDWECHIINNDAFSLNYSNQVERGEMCNMWGSSVGPKIDCVL